MDRKTLNAYKKNKTELMLINKRLDKLQEQLSNVEIVSGKVTKSSEEFPYIEEHMTVQMADPKKTNPIMARIKRSEKRKSDLEKEILRVNIFLSGIPEGIDREIFEMVYLDGMTLQKVGETIGYSKGRVSQIISGYLED